MASIPGIQIAIVLDKSGSIPVIRVTDTTNYGTPSGVTGVLSILQPDTMSYIGSFASPDIYYTSGALLVAQKELRLASNNNFQKGNYVITYTARLSGYDDTTIIKSFSIDYTQPVGDITTNIDVFTPALKANDTTNYVVTNFALQTINRSWTSTSTPGNSGAGNVSQFDLSIGGKYYDAAYVITLSSIMTYLLNGSTNVSIIDKFTTTSNFSTLIPNSLNTLFAEINAFKASIGTAGATCQTDYATNKANYIYAYTLFMNFIHRGTCGDKTALLGLYQELLTTLNSGNSVSYTPTNGVIPTYNFGSFCGIGAVSVPLFITQQPVSLTQSTGSSATFTVAASGLAALTYQWRKGGVNIPGATNSSYNIPSISSGDQATYDCVIHDGLSNSLTSSTATLTVTAAVVNFTAYWAWVGTDPFTALQTADSLTYQGNGSFVSGNSIIADYRSAPNLQFLVLKVPSTESIKQVWSNGPFNNGNIPDPVWRSSFVTGGFRYYVTNQLLTLDSTATTTFA